MKTFKRPFLGLISATFLMSTVALAQSGPSVILRCDGAQGKQQTAMVDFVKIEKGLTVGYKRVRNAEMPKAVISSSATCSVFPVTEYQQQ